MYDSLIRPIPLDVKHDWTVTLNGQPIEASEFVAVHPVLGRLSWGLRREGTVGWVWQETGGGGTGTVPYGIVNGQLMIGMIKQERPTMPDGVAWNTPRGFLEPGQSHFESAVRETKEELWIIELTGNLDELPGEPGNSNSTFFDTRAGNGLRYFALHISQFLLNCSQQESVFRPGLFAPRSAAAERIMECRFVPWRRPLGLPTTLPTRVSRG